ncbi:GNAT family N-acetyltransferase [Virgibacillus flavescens]|uniref:GNAT family N-acetyltransferase n=1 Tax=Virgibacillus flavescens TaxID=1611422 RepID=UPI003D326464
MQATLDNGKEVIFREYEEEDFPQINKLNELEGWNTLVERAEETREALENSNITYVALIDEKIVGYVRGMTDKQITLFICEVIIDKELRGSGIGKKILQYVHAKYPKTRMELLGSSTSKSFYEKLKFRPFYGFRKTIQE